MPLLDLNNISPRRPILLVGIGGMLHRAWVELLDSIGISHISPTLEQLDLTRPETIERAVRPGCSVVINCAAYTDVDGAEANDAIAFEVNAYGVGLLAQRCRAIGAPLVHYSTDYVFDGEGSAPHRVDALPRPVNAYGRSKAMGELLLRESECRHLLVRTSWLYAPWGKNFVRTISQMATERPVLRIVADQIGRPTSAQHLVKANLQLLEAVDGGVFHVTDGGQCSWFELAREIVRLSGARCQVEPCTSVEFARPARRPANSVLDLSATEALIGPRPHWTRMLADVMRSLEPQAPAPPSPSPRGSSMEMPTRVEQP
jgi:dTDP-4-dehydrorhamnose reductase